jgi:hypothetical protein
MQQCATTHATPGDQMAPAYATVHCLLNSNLAGKSEEKSLRCSRASNEYFTLPHLIHVESERTAWTLLGISLAEDDVKS